MEIVVWEEKYNTGIKLIDEQHRELAGLINELYRACRAGEEVGVAFKAAMSRMVEYVHHHYATEQKFMLKIKYPGYNEHLKEHDVLVKDILGSAKDFNQGKRFVPHHFVRTLRDWLLSHIAVSDKQYAAYFVDQLKKGHKFDI